MLSTILTAAAIILLLVLLVPVGVALYQRIKPAPPRRPEAPPRAAPPPPRVAEMKVMPAMKAPEPAPRVAIVDPPTDRVRAVTERPLAAPDPMDATRMTRLDEKPQESEGGGTEMVEWYGMLRCTAGPLEGQTFIVENEGLYIGRDASMAQIVVNDSRVSKRHLRILPRNGKVWAIDEGSTNGTYLDNATGERITEHQLKRGETLVLAEGAASFVYQI